MWYIRSHAVGCGIVLVYNVKHDYVTQDTSLQAASSPGYPSSTLSVWTRLSLTHVEKVADKWAGM